MMIMSGLFDLFWTISPAVVVVVFDCMVVVSAGLVVEDTLVCASCSATCFGLVVVVIEADGVGVGFGVEVGEGFTGAGGFGVGVGVICCPPDKMLFKANLVAGPTMPRGWILLAFWKAMTAFLVAEPYVPVMEPEKYPRFLRRVCSCITCLPVEPIERFAVKTKLAGGALTTVPAGGETTGLLTAGVAAETILV